MHQHDSKILAEYEQGLEPLLDLPAALQILLQAGYRYTFEYGPNDSQKWTFTHPDDDGEIVYNDKQDIIDMAYKLLEAEKAMQQTLQEALPELSDQEAVYLADEASKRW